jgi:outer membrane protein OmpA-like peptidoglycan-associated protein
MLSSNHISGGLSSHTYAQLIRKNGANGDSLYIDLQNALDKMPKTGYLSFNANFDLLSFSIRFGKARENMIFFNMTERLSVKLSYPKSLPEFVWKGNAAFLGETVDFKKLNVDASHFREYGLAYARQFLDKSLSVGITVKYLYGMENISSSKNTFSVYTDPNSYDITARSDFRLNSSGLLTSDAFDDFSNGNIGRYLFARNNHGFAFNVGAHYKGKENWEVAASVLDLGTIFWKDNPRNYIMHDAQFTYSGMDIAQFLSSDSTDYFQEFGDSLVEAFKIAEASETYSSMLPTRIYVNGAYNFTEKDRLGLDFYGEAFRNHFEPAVALNYTHKFGHIFHLSGSYMYNNHSFGNLGVGFALTLGPVQWYMNLDNVLGPIIPQHSQNFHFHSGLNFVVGYKETKKSDRDGDGILDKVDNCPDQFGLGLYLGCPDTDLDSIPDHVDNCPVLAGPKENGGCPWGDKDADGVTDNLDKCPEVVGPSENEGCPWGDKDGDTVLDNVDACVEVPGPVANNGCPWGDRDADGINDGEDKCPDEAGPADNNGCPWGDKDGDGVKDNEDRCPEIPGPVDNQGCPYQDSDGDGVIDLEDDCPRTPGPKENKGCPVIEQEEQEVLNTAFDNLEFETGKDVIKATSYRSLDELAELMKKKESYRLGIAGHTDNVGSDAINMQLSEKRSKAVATYLTNRGVDAARFTVEWFGETKPLYPNDTPEGRTKNRRVEMKVMFD